MAQEKQKQAAFDLDEIRGQNLEKISAADLLQALHHGGLHVGHLTTWPEKKKYELWVEPENFGEIEVGRLIDILRGEKKKVELEKFPGLERFRDPREGFIDPVEGRLDQLADRVARLVEMRLSR